MFWCIRAPALMLALPVSVALGSVQDKISESRVSLPVSVERGFAGEMGYAFDTALNITHGSFRASLAPRGILSRIFRGTPTVHTLAAAYEVAGRAAGNTPDSIRVSLVSDEFSQAYPGNGPPPFPEPVLTITVADSVARLPLGISQKIEIWRSRDSGMRVVRSSQTRDFGASHNIPEPRMHIRRTATVRLSTCAFLALLAGKDARGTVAGLEFDINEDVMAGLREFAAEFGAGTTARNCN
jgi:hypothetical protein